MYNLSEKAITEKYEDLLFTKVMALYAAEESEKILSEIKDEEPADLKKIEKIYSKTERRENLSVFWKVSKKLITVAAMVVFVAVVSLSSVVVASAEAREAVAEAIYHLMIKEYDRYTEVSIGNSTGFIDPEIYDWEGAYAPTYIPEGFSISDTQFTNNDKSVMYSHGEDYFYISQTNNLSYARIDTEGSEHVEKIIIGNSEAFLVYENEIVSLVWICGETYLSIDGKISIDEAIKIAEGIKPLGKTEEPTEEYKFVDPELYDWEGAYGLTFVPDAYKFKEKKSAGTKNVIIYESNNGHFTFSQSNGNPIARVDTEDAENVETIIINESEALLVEKDGFVIITWNNQNTFFSLRGTLPADTLIFMAQGIKPIGKTETEESAEEYEFVDPENYNFEGAYAPTYIPEGYIFDEKQELTTRAIITYSNGNSYFTITQSNKTASLHMDTEDADSISEVMINNSQGILVEKDGFSSLAWNVDENFFWVRGEIESAELTKVAEGIRPIN